MECYDSKSEAINQARLNNVNTDNKICISLLVNMTNTVFDKLSTEDINKLEIFYNKYKDTIHNSHENHKDIDLETYAIIAYKKKEFDKLSIIRDTKTIKSDKHDLNCISKRNVLLYKIIDTNCIKEMNVVINN